MTVVLYRKDIPIRLYNVETVSEVAPGTFKLTNAFGGEPKEFDHITEVRIEASEPDDEEDEEEV